MHHPQITDPREIRHFEVHDSHAASTAHQETPHFDAFFEAVDGLEVSWSTVGYHLVWHPLVERPGVT